MIYTYSRVSTDKQANSTDLQAKVLTEFCQRKGFLNRIDLVDSDVSGGKSIFKRPEGSKLSELKSGDTLIVTKHDRVFRSHEDAVVTVNKWFKLGVNIYLLNIGETPINMENPVAKFQLYIMMAAAELEKDNISLRTREGINNRKSNKQVYSAAPYGWDNTYLDEEKKVSKLVKNEDEQEIIRRMITLRNTMKKSYSIIATALNDLNIPSKEGGKWYASTVRTILNNTLNN